MYVPISIRLQLIFCRSTTGFASVFLLLFVLDRLLWLGFRACGAAKRKARKDFCPTSGLRDMEDGNGGELIIIWVSASCKSG